MSPYEPLGYLASVLVLATFSVREMTPLRLLAIASNLAFIGYAALIGIGPVLLLHVLLLPINIWRLIQGVQHRHRTTPMEVSSIAWTHGRAAVERTKVDTNLDESTSD